MLLSLLCIGYFLGAIFLFPESIESWIKAEENAMSLNMKLPFVEEARESLGLSICFLVNLLFLVIGLKKAKQPDYNINLFRRQEGKLP